MTVNFIPTFAKEALFSCNG